jgi:hypothetical protein
MPTLSTHALRTAVVGIAMTDPDFARALAADATAAVEARFGAQPYTIRYVLEHDNDVTILVPEKTEPLMRLVSRSVADIGDRPPTRGQFDALIVHKAWTDATFLDRLQRDPRATLDAELQAYGSSLPTAKNPKVYVEQPGECVILLAAAGQEPGGSELSDEELEAVAGGEEVAIVVASVILPVIHGEWICS